MSKKEFEGKSIEVICRTGGYGRITEVVSQVMEIDGVRYIDIGRRMTSYQDKETGKTMISGKAGYLDPKDAEVHCKAVLEYLAKHTKWDKTPRSVAGGEVKTTKLDLSKMSEAEKLEWARKILASAQGTATQSQKADVAKLDAVEIATIATWAMGQAAGKKSSTSRKSKSTK